MANPNPTTFIFLIIVIVGLIIQSLLLGRALGDLNSFKRQLRFYGGEMSMAVRQFFEDALVTSKVHRDQALIHLAIKLGGVGLGIWGLFVPPPIRPQVTMFSFFAGIYILLVFTALDLVAFRDYRGREKQKALHEKRVADQARARAKGGPTIDPATPRGA